MNIPSQSQSSPIIHFTTPIRQRSNNLLNPIDLSPSISLESTSQHDYQALIHRPQSTPISSPILSTKTINHIQQSTNENFISLVRKKRKLYFENSSLTTITPLNNIHNQIESLSSSEEDDDEHLTKDRFYLRPPPLMVLSQSIQAKHPEQLNDSKLTDRFSSIKDLPNSPANYSFVFYNFTSTQIEESKRLTRRMGDCFTSETIDLTTTHIIFANDDPQISIKLDLILASIYGCYFVTFEWLKCSSRIGEWLNITKYQPKEFLHQNSFLNFYRKYRHEKKSIQLFNQCGWIYLTSIVQQRALLIKLITILGGNITINRNRANIIVGHSSKILPIITYPQVTEQWIIDSILNGQCLPMENYFLSTSTI